MAANNVDLSKLRQLCQAAMPGSFSNMTSGFSFLTVFITMVVVFFIKAWIVQWAYNYVSPNLPFLQGSKLDFITSMGLVLLVQTLFR